MADDCLVGPWEFGGTDEARDICRGLDEAVAAVPRRCRTVPRHVERDDPPTGGRERRPKPPPAARAGTHPVDKEERRVVWATPGEEMPPFATRLDCPMLARRRRGERVGDGWR
jgi:hypothetical protein